MSTNWRVVAFAALAVSASGAFAFDPDEFDVWASVSMSSRWFNDADDDLNHPLDWPGSALLLGSGPGTLAYSLDSRVYDYGAPLEELFDDLVMYDDPMNAFVLADGVGVHKLPEGRRRAGTGWDPDNPAITSLAISSLERRSFGWENDYGDKAYVQRGTADAFSGVKRYPQLYREAEAGGHFFDSVTLTDLSGLSADGFRDRRFVKESWGAIASTTFDPFADLPESRWSNRLDFAIRDPGSPGPALLSAGAEAEAWFTRGVASVSLDQGRDGIDVFPEPLEPTGLLDPARYTSVLTLECLIVPGPERVLLTEDHVAQFSIGALFHDQGEILPPDFIDRFDGMVEIVNGDFNVYGDLLGLDWTVTTVASELPGFDLLRAEAEIQTPWAFNLDLAGLAPGVDELAIDLDIEQFWHTYAPVPAPAGITLLGVAALAARRRR